MGDLTCGGDVGDATLKREDDTNIFTPSLTPSLENKLAQAVSLLASVCGIKRKCMKIYLCSGPKTESQF